MTDHPGQTERSASRRVEVRAVNGDGPACTECGGRSALHVCVGPVLPDHGGEHYFVCEDCTLEMVRTSLAPYVVPRFNGEEALDA